MGDAWNVVGITELVLSGFLNPDQKLRRKEVFELIRLRKVYDSLEGMKYFLDKRRMP